jgi:ADP-ribose pyrophosphatase YjhB (NUDIX family)
LTDAQRSLRAAIAEVENQLPDVTRGLPEELFLFVSRVTPLINVDLLIQDDAGRTLLTWRSDRFFGDGWHVPGGIIRFRESAATRVAIVAREELRTTVTFDPAVLMIHESIAPERRDRGHSISLLYRCRLMGELDVRYRVDPERPLPNQWLWHDSCPENLILEQRVYAQYMG